MISLLVALAGAAEGPEIGGYVHPRFIALYRPDEVDEDLYELGVGSSKAGLHFSGAASENWSYKAYLVLGADTVLVVNETYGIDEDLDGTLDDVGEFKTGVMGDIVRETTVKWRPSDDFGLTMGRMQVPFSAQDCSSDTALMFPTRASPTAVFREPRDLGAYALMGQAGEVISGAVGLFNGDGLGATTSDERGAAVLTRIDWHPAGFFAFDETDRGWDGFRIGFGAGLLWHPWVSFDEGGDTDVTYQDFRGSGTIRMATKGLLISGEFLWRYQIDDLTNRPFTAYGAYGQLGWLRESGVEPVARIGWTEETAGAEPWVTAWTEGGVNVYPLKAEERERVRIAVLAQGEHRLTEGETALAANAGVQVTF